MARCLLLFTLLLLVITGGWAAPPASLAAAIDQHIANADLPGATIGLYVQSLTDGNIWYARNECRAFIPASNAKIFTGVLALEYLLPEYRFTTRLFADGAIVDGVLQGNLYLRGGGDPSLSPADLQTMAQALAAGDAAAGRPPIHAVRGRLLLDDGFFPRPGPLRCASWEASDLPWYYAAPASALSCNRNAVTVTVRGDKVGARPEVTLTPATTLFTIHNRAKTSTKVRTGAVEVIPKGYSVHITGKVAPGAELVEKISIPDPRRFTAEQFRTALQAAGLTIGATAVGDVDPQRHALLLEHQSAPVSEIVAFMLQESDNHTAEQLYWTLLSLYSLEKPLGVRYSAMLQDFAAYSGMRDDNGVLVDGSGLSRMNRLTPIQMARFLIYMATSPNYGLFYRALPEAGLGTLKKRLLATSAAGNVHAKTGTMRGVSNLSGYVTTKSGERLIFIIFVNGYANGAAVARKLQDGIVCDLASCP